MTAVTDYVGGDFRYLLSGERFLLDGSDAWVMPRSDDDFVALIEAARGLHHEWIGGFLERYDSDADVWETYYVTASLEGIVCDIALVPDRNRGWFDPDGGVDFPDRKWCVEALERYIGDEDLVRWLNLGVWDTLPTVWQVDEIVAAWAEAENTPFDTGDHAAFVAIEQKLIRDVQQITGELVSPF